MIKAVLFDLYLTLIDVSRVNQEEQDKAAYNVVSKFGLKKGFEEFKDVFKKVYEKWKEFRQKYLIEVNPRVWWQETLLKLGIPPKLKLVESILEERHKIFLKQIKLYDDVIDVLKILNKRNILIGIMSNCSDARYAKEELEYLGLADYVDFFISSAEYGRRKPDVNLFLNVLSSIPFTKEEIIMIGDDYKNDVEPWRRLGVKAYLLRRESGDPDENTIHTLYELNKIISIN
ncbi:MAG: HAD family hydrolase [Candidatus Odinarchaeum yellowstonii]|uniref:HAD family hydrolase n=1 Tax=Odinarchaeota yellowstonii (strain LCB_4) TaxID=1841599 RepID=A0AAF0D2Q1_ODILC|nr:MAG: HAD family hydrolase [Candidatus Odinarchaeum yellowstonii]